MLQQWVGPHVAPQDFSFSAATTTSGTAGSMVAMNVTGGGSTAKTTDFSVGIFTTFTGSATGVSGFYYVRKYERVPGFDDMLCMASVGASFSGVPADATIMAFTTTQDLALAPAVPLNDSRLTWIPLDITTSGSHVSCVQAFPVKNDGTLVQWFGVVMFGTLGGTARQLNGAVSLRQVTDEKATFIPSK